jgi:hypothetical protein
VKNDIDLQSVCDLVAEMQETHKTILKFFLPTDEHLLKHLAASAIHLSFFLKDLAEIVKGFKIPISKELEDRFTDDCGCDFNDKE